MKKVLIAILFLLWSVPGFTADSGQVLLIAEGTDAATGSFFFDYAKIPATCHITGTISTTALGEEITVQTLDNDGVTWQDIVEAGTTKILDSENTIIAIYASGTYNFSKSATASAAGLICTY